MPNSYDHCATLPQIAHEIAQGGRDGGEVVFSLVYDAQRSPYRARGLALYAVAVEFSWLAGAVGLIGIDGHGTNIKRMEFNVIILVLREIHVDHAAGRHALHQCAGSHLGA